MSEAGQMLLPKPGDDDSPSLADQATARGWQGGIFSFGKADEGDVAHFNPSLVLRPDGLWLIVRRAVFSATDRFGQNSVWAFKLNNWEELKPEFGRRLRWDGEQELEHFEDPRAFFSGTHTYVGACNFIWHGNGDWTGAHQVLGVFTTDQIRENDWACLKKYAPAIGGNHPQVDERGRKNEKNWLWWITEKEDNDPALAHRAPAAKQKRLAVLYHSNPWRVAVFGKEGFENATPYEMDTGIVWAHGEIRGGTPPVLIDGLYWTFFHSSVPWIGRFRRYHMGALAFDSKPPFHPRYITPEPLLTGSQNDAWADRKPLVVFPCGALIKDGEWLVTYGINDLKSGWAKLPHPELLELVVPIGGERPKKNLSRKQERRKKKEFVPGDGVTNSDPVPLSPPVWTPARLDANQTIGDQIRFHVAALVGIGTNANRDSRIKQTLLRELRKARLIRRR